jgi:membrane protein DedA with SNARE-associated domain
MSLFLDNLLGLIVGVIDRLGYPGLVVLGALVPPEAVLPFAGFLVASDELTFTWALLAATLGATIKHGAFFLAARSLGTERIRKVVKRYGKFFLLSTSGLERALELFERMGGRLVFVGCFVPNVRTLVTVPAGCAKMRLWRFLLVHTLGTLLWNGGLLLAGTLVGRNWEVVRDALSTYKQVIYIGLGVIVLGALLRRFWPRLWAKGAS